MAILDDLKQSIFDYSMYRMGQEMITVEADPVHYEFAYSRALEVYRQRSSNAQEESYSFLELQADTQEYTLPQEVTLVKQIFRRTIGSSSNSAANQFEPFEAGYINTYLLTAGRTGGLLSYELYTQYQELSARMFGGFINFTFNPVTKKLVIVRRPQSSGEIVMLWTYNMKPEIQLLSDYRIMPWIKEYTYLVSKHMVGEARSKFSTIPGPQGGTSLNGNDLKADAKEAMDKMIEDLRNFVDGSMPFGFVIG